MTPLLKVCGAAMILLVFLLIARGERHTAIVGSAAGLIILAFIVARAAPIVEFIGSISADTSYTPIVGILLRALGVTLLADATASVCRDSGEGGLADKVEFAGRIEVLLIALPLVAEILNLAKEMIGNA